MELLDGHPLTEHVGAPLDLRRALRLVTQLAVFDARSDGRVSFDLVPALHEQALEDEELAAEMSGKRVSGKRVSGKRVSGKRVSGKRMSGD